jgi:hypothetical protein
MLAAVAVGLLEAMLIVGMAVLGVEVGLLLATLVLLYTTLTVALPILGGVAVELIALLTLKHLTAVRALSSSGTWSDG